MTPLREASAEKGYEETASGGRWDQPELSCLLDQLRPGGMVLVWNLDRRSSSLKDLPHPQLRPISKKELSARQQRRARGA